MANEAYYTREFCKRLQHVGAIVYPLVGQTRGVAGWPDRLIISHWWHGLIEFKLGEKGSLKTRQGLILQEITNRCFGLAFVVWMYADSDVWILYWFSNAKHKWVEQRFNRNCDSVQFLQYLQSMKTMENVLSYGERFPSLFTAEQLQLGDVEGTPIE